MRPQWLSDSLQNAKLYTRGRALAIPLGLRPLGFKYICIQYSMYDMCGVYIYIYISIVYIYICNYMCVCYVMLCYVVLCCVVLCCVVLCCVMLCYVTLRYVTYRYV